MTHPEHINLNTTPSPTRSQLRSSVYEIPDYVLTKEQGISIDTRIGQTEAAVPESGPPRYLLIQTIYSGDVSNVYLGWDAKIGRFEAVKALPPSLPGHRYHRTTTKEARMIARLEHPNIVPVHNVVFHQQCTYVFMRYMDPDISPTLDHHMTTNGNGRTPFSPETLSRTIRTIGSALDYAHSKSIIHRDVKPGNIFVEHDGTAYLADFNIAINIEDIAHEDPFASIGTPAYMSPEAVFCPNFVTEQSDNYALAVVAYEMLYRQLPHTSSTVNGIKVGKILYPSATPEASRVVSYGARAQDILEVLMKQLASRPEDRFPTCLNFSLALDTALGVI
jgi:serine/threonine protein kinase